MFLTDMLALCHVPRWVIVDHSRSQSVAEHSFRVVVIAADLWKRIHSIEPTAAFYEYALSHDRWESRTGDIPSTYKPFCNKIDEGQLPIIMGELLVIKLADLIEAYTFITRYGIGPHADSVARSIFAKINNEDEYGPGVREAANRIIGSILGDEGRYEGPAPAHRVYRDRLESKEEAKDRDGLSPQERLGRIGY